MADQLTHISSPDSTRIQAHLGRCIELIPGRISCVTSTPAFCHLCARPQIRSTCEAGVVLQLCGAGSHRQPRRRDRRLSHLRIIGQRASLLKTSERFCLSHLYSRTSEVTPYTTVNPTGPMVMHSIIKLQPYDGTGSLDTFLTRFQRMAVYLWWDDEDMFHHLCACLKGLWDKSCGTLFLVRQLPTSFTSPRQGLALSSMWRD